jgi:hypothetical protein
MLANFLKEFEGLNRKARESFEEAFRKRMKRSNRVRN